MYRISRVAKVSKTSEPTLIASQCSKDRTLGQAIRCLMIRNRYLAIQQLHHPCYRNILTVNAIAFVIAFLYYERKLSGAQQKSNRDTQEKKRVLPGKKRSYFAPTAREGIVLILVSVTGSQPFSTQTTMKNLINSYTS